eukprot:1535462-Heterocapsa_arctica.AAC.1
MYEEIAVTQISGEQKDDEDTNIADCSEVGQTIGNDKQQKHQQYQQLDLKGTDIYYGVSSQKRVTIRAAQLFREGQANKAIQTQSALQNQLRKMMEKEQRILE